ncbi:2,3-bisphosphoglycerate-dependent phosphoglycerate mutase [Paenibacillus castaneae]|uniref:histidine phosphatase family protein n=1 Tax=Paenibacillus castaneae TaxID=474957 RepID=UPI000C9B224F|nr:histidine phosphatase family protein [Paenibacillus castaneae]NIK80036.1 2,3-bisphosphoglycerate-dependent phosphoglycerate mutase [Paenibacillus castaneae]
MKSIYLIRHCKALGQEPEAALTKEGQQQAEALALYLQDKEIEYIISSPFERAVQTIIPLSQCLGRNIHIDDRLAERVLSTSSIENWLEVLEKTYSDYELKLEGGESSQEASERALHVIEDLMKRPEKTICAVTHGALLSLIIKHFNADFGFEDWKRITNPDIYLLRIDNDHTAIERVWESN